MGDNGIRTHWKKVCHFRNPALLCCTQGYFSDIFNGIQNIFICFLRLNVDQITVYQSLFINKANVNRGSRNGMTCSKTNMINHSIKPIGIMLSKDADKICKP